MQYASLTPSSPSVVHSSLMMQRFGSSRRLVSISFGLLKGLFRDMFLAQLLRRHRFCCLHPFVRSFGLFPWRLLQRVIDGVHTSTDKLPDPIKGSWKEAAETLYRWTDKHKSVFALGRLDSCTVNRWPLASLLTFFFLWNEVSRSFRNPEGRRWSPFSWCCRSPPPSRDTSVSRVTVPLRVASGILSKSLAWPRGDVRSQGSRSNHVTELTAVWLVCVRTTTRLLLCVFSILSVPQW